MGEQTNHVERIPDLPAQAVAGDHADRVAGGLLGLHVDTSPITLAVSGRNQVVSVENDETHWVGHDRR